MAWKVEQDEKTLKEVCQYSDVGFPFEIWPDLYNIFNNRMVDAHWHYDFEYSYVASGFLDYYINDAYIRLVQGDCVFVNSNMLHMARQPENCSNAILYTMTFPTDLLTSDINSTLYKKYLQPIIATQLGGFKISSGDPIGMELANLITELLKIYFPYPMLSTKTISPANLAPIREIVDKHLDNFVIISNNSISKDTVTRLKKNAEEGLPFGYELECMDRITRVLALTAQYIEGKNGGLIWHTGSMASNERAREILNYLHQNYHERITVDDISKHLNISRNECFRCFKQLTGKKPIGYLNNYRLLNAAQMLRETDKNIEIISSECGFASASFFSKQFKEKFARTPVQYRKMK